VEDQRFDRLARQLGARQSRRQALTALGAAAAIVAIPAAKASAGSPCVLTCPDHVYVGTTEGTCTATVTLGEPTAVGACGASPEIVCEPMGPEFPIGETTINCSIVEPAVSCSYLVYIYDANPDIFTCPADIEMTSEGPASVNFDWPGLSSICTDYGNEGSFCDHIPGDVFPLGTTTVNCEWPYGKGDSYECSFDVTLAPAPATATPTEVPPTATETEVPATTVPGEPTATEVPETVVATTVPGDPTATPAPVTELPNTGTGDGGSDSFTKLLPVAVGAAGIALLARLGLRQRPAEATITSDE